MQTDNKSAEEMNHKLTQLVNVHTVAFWMDDS